MIKTKDGLDDLRNFAIENFCRAAYECLLSKGEALTLQI